MNFSQDICNYTKEGRVKLHQNLRADIAIEINKMSQIPYDKDNLEFADNRISRYSRQLGNIKVLPIAIKRKGPLVGEHTIIFVVVKM